MSNTVKRNLLLILVATCMLAFCVVIANFAYKQKAAAESVVIIPDITAEESGFYMLEGASIYTPDDETDTVVGIRFTSIITESFWGSLATEYEGATFNFYAVVTDGTTGIRKDYGQIAPRFFNGVDKLHATIKYNVSEWESADKALAYALELKANIYIDATIAETTTTIAAAKDTGVRSMQVVANFLYMTETINDEPNEWYQSEALTTYFTEGNRSETSCGFVDEDGQGFVEMPSLPAVGTVSAYIGTKKITSNVSDGVISFSGVDATDMSVGDETYISAFVNNSVYSCKISYADLVLNNGNVSALLNSEKMTGNKYIVVAEDIDMSTAYTDNSGVWTSSITFVGDIYGRGHKITNFKTNSGLFNQFNGNISDLAFIDVNVSSGVSYVGVISNGYQRTGASSVLVENVYISLSVVDSGTAGFFGTINPGSPVTLKDSILIDKTAYFLKSCFFGKFGSVAMSLNNAWLVGRREYVESLNTNLTPEQQRALHLPDSLADKYKKYSSLSAFIDDCLADKVSVSTFIDSIIEEDIMSDITAITSENVADLLTATSGYYYLAEDIDMSTAYTDNNGVWASSTIFTGTLNGNGHTVSKLKTSTGLFSQLGSSSGAATVNIYDIALIDVQVTGQVGALAQITGIANGNLTVNIDNIYVKHSVAPAWGGGGLFGRTLRLGSQGTVMNITNSVVYVNGVGGGSYGSLAYAINDAYGLNINNCYFVGAGGTLVVVANVAITPTGGGVYANFDEFRDDYAVDNVNVSKFIKDILESDMGITRITKENVADLLTATGGYYVLTEDIDMATYYVDENEEPKTWVSSASFGGTLNGGGHKIDNLKTSTGLFGTVNGAGAVIVKNIAFTNVATIGSIGVLGGYSRTAANRITVDNAYIHIKSNSGGWYVGVLGQANLAASNSFTMSNSVMVSNITYGAVIGRVGSYGINLTNCYLVNTKEFTASLHSGLTAEEQRALHVPETNTTSSYTTVAELQTDYEAGNVVNLKDFIKNILNLA